MYRFVYRCIGSCKTHWNVDISLAQISLFICFGIPSLRRHICRFYKNVSCEIIVPHLFSFSMMLCVGDEPLCNIVALLLPWCVFVRRMVDMKLVSQAFVAVDRPRRWWPGWMGLQHKYRWKCWRNTPDTQYNATGFTHEFRKLFARASEDHPWENEENYWGEGRREREKIDMKSKSKKVQQLTHIRQSCFYQAEPFLSISKQTTFSTYFQASSDAKIQGSDCFSVFTRFHVCVFFAVQDERWDTFYFQMTTSNKSSWMDKEKDGRKRNEHVINRLCALLLIVYLVQVLLMRWCEYMFVYDHLSSTLKWPDNANLLRQIIQN